MAALLSPGGIVASFGGPVRLASSELAAAVVAARGPVLPDDGVASPDGTPEDEPLQWPGTELVASPLFGDVRQLVVERRLLVSADDYLGRLGTVSAYLVLPPADRAAVLDRIAAVIPPQVELVADLLLHLARRI